MTIREAEAVNLIREHITNPARNMLTAREIAEEIVRGLKLKGVKFTPDSQEG